MRMKYDEIDKLILFKVMNISVDVPEHLRADFDLRWAQFEQQRAELKRKEKLVSNPLGIRRWDVNDEAVWETMQECGSGDYVLYEDYEIVVKHLQEQLDRAWSEASSGKYDSSTSWRD